MIKEEPEQNLNLVYEVGYCRCCFKTVNLIESHSSAEEETLSLLQDITQMQLEPSPLASSFCENCLNEIKGFENFKKLAIVKQQRFIILSTDGGDLRELQELTLTSDPLVKYEEDEQPIVKEEFNSYAFENEIAEQHEDKTSDHEQPQVSQKTKVPKKRGPRMNNYPTCPICFSKVHFLPNHLLRCHPICCEHCKFKTIKPEELDKHIKRKHKETILPEPPQICPICGKALKSNLERHIEAIHEKMRNYHCDLCDYSGYHKDYIINHMKSVHLESELKCDSCDYVTNSTKLLKLHINNRHTDISEQAHKRTICVHCNRSFKSKAYMAEHVFRKHGGVREFTCDVCLGKFFTQKEVE